MYNMLTVVNIAILYMKIVKRVNCKSTHHEQEKFFSFAIFWFLCEMMDVNYLW